MDTRWNVDKQMYYFTITGVKFKIEGGEKRCSVSEVRLES